MLAFSFLFIFKVVIVVLFLCVASIYDLRTRLVPNFVWVYFLPVVVVLGLVECVLYGFSAVSWLLVSYGLTFVLGFGGFWVGLFGGADAKCLLCLGLCFPFFPFTVMPGFVLFVFMFGAVIAVMVNVMRMIVFNLVDLLRGCLCFPNVSWMRRLVLFFGATQVNVSRVDGLVWVPILPVVSDQVERVWARFQEAFIWHLTFGFVVGFGVWVVAVVLVGVV